LTVVGGVAATVLLCFNLASARRSTSATRGKSRDQGKIARTDHNKHPLLAAKPELKGPIQGLGSDKPAGRLSGSFSQRQTAQVIRGI
jgi:hypothetical protein